METLNETSSAFEPDLKEKSSFHPASTESRKLVQKAFKQSELKEIYNAGKGINIHFHLHDSVHLQLEVYDATGRIIHTVADKGMLAGTHCITWDLNEFELHIPPGAYLLQLKTFEEANASVQSKVFNII